MLVRNRTNVYDFTFNVVFVTKNRQAVFAAATARDDITTILQQLAYGMHVQLTHLVVNPTYVQLWLSFPPTMTPSEVVKNLKGSTARLWFKQHPATKATLAGGHLWTPNYLMTTVGTVTPDVVSRYVASQRTCSNPR